MQLCIDNQILVPFQIALINHLHRLAQLGIVYVNVAHGRVQVLVSDKDLDHARVDAFVSQGSNKLPSAAV